MKNSKLLLTSLLAAATMISVPAFGAGEIISINFGKTDTANVVDGTENGTAGLATISGSDTGVSAGGWTNASGQNGTVSTLKNHDGETIAGASVAWTCGNAAWGPNNWDTTTLLGTIQSSYLDLSADNTWNISVDTPFLVCDVYLYFSGDGSKYSPVNVNGTSYIGGTNVLAGTATEWGDRGQNASGTLTLGMNTILVTGTAGIVSLSNVPQNDSAKRATISGMQIVNSYAGTAHAATLGGDSAWSGVSFDTAWANSQSTVDAATGQITSTNGAYADFTLTADTTLTFDSAVVTDAIYVSGEGKTLTLSNAGSGSLTLSGPATLSANAGATLAFDTSIFNLADNVSGIKLAGAGTIAFTDADGTAAYNKIGTNFTASSNTTVRIDGAVNLGENALAVSSGIREFAGGLTAGAVTVSGGTLNITGSATLGGATLTGGKLAVAAGANVSVSETVEMGTATLDGGTAGITAVTLKFGYGGGVNTATIQGKVNVTGNLQESSSGAANGEAISLAEGASLSVGGTFGTTSTNAADWGQHSYVVNVGAGASFSAGTIAHGDSLTVNIGGGNAAVSATTLVLNSVWGNKTHAFTGQGAGVSTLSVGTINLKNEPNKTTTFSVSNARLEVGAGGITGKSSTPVSLSGVTLGVRDGADSWSSDLSMTLAGTMGADVGADKSISLGGNLSGTIETLTKTGAGKLTLSGDNTYTGRTVIEAGTLVAANASALGTGNVTVADGATLDARAGLQVGRAASEDGATAAIASTLTTEGSAKLVLGALNTTTAAIAAQGDVTLSAGTIFDVGALVEGGKVVSSAGTLTVASGTLTKDNFLLNGSALGDRMSFNVSTNGNTVKISDLTGALSLMWNNYSTVEGNTNVWTANGSGWYDKDTSTVPPVAQTFQNGDSVNFVDGALGLYKEVRIDGSVTVSAMVVDGEFTFTGQNGAAIFSTGTLTKRGTDTAKIDSTVDLSGFTGGIEIGLNGGKLVVDTASGYTGAVTAGENGTFTLNVSSDTTLSNTLSGAGKFEKTGEGTLTISSANAGLTGQFVISEGTVKLGTTGNVFGAAEREAVVVNAGGTLDVNGKAVFYKVELAGGELVNNGSGIDTNTPQLRGMRLSANSSVISKNNFGLISDNRAGNELNLAGHTLTKTGSNMFWLVSTNVTAGVIDVREGALVVMNGNSAEKKFSMAEGALIKIDGGELKAGVITNGTYRNVSLGDVAIVLTDANKGTARITADTNCSFNAGGATLYLDIGALTAATLTPGEDVSLTIAAASAIANDSFFSTVEVGTYEDDVWQISSKWKYLAESWNASAGTLSITAIPEPSVFGLLAGLGALALAGTRRRRRKA